MSEKCPKCGHRYWTASKKEGKERKCNNCKYEWNPKLEVFPVFPVPDYDEYHSTEMPDTRELSMEEAPDTGPFVIKKEGDV